MTIAGPSPRARVANLRPAAWYRFGVGITSSAGLVSAWADQTSNVRHLLQATGGNQPALQSDGSILFDGTASFMAAAFTLPQPLTIYLLFRQVTWTGSDVICDGVTSGSAQLLQTGATPAITLNGGSSVASNTGLAVNAYGIATAVFSGAASSLGINKKPLTTGNPGTTTTAGFTLGGDGVGANNGNIQVKEVILFPAAHNPQQQYQVIGYLSNIGGLAL